MVGRAELFAIVYALENCLPPILIKTDHLNHVKKIRKGERHCRSLLLSPYIDLWQRLWDQIERLGGYGREVRIEYVPEHRKLMPGLPQAVVDDIVGNDMADKCAKRGRDMHSCSAQILNRYEEIHSFQTNYTRWLGAAVALRYDEQTTDVIQPPKGRTVGAKRAEAPTVDSQLRKKLSDKRQKVVWLQGSSPLAMQILVPPTWHSVEEGAYFRIMTKLLDRVQGSQPSLAVRRARLRLWRGRGSRTVDAVVKISGPIRERQSAIQETGQHDIRQSDGVLWCAVCGLYTLKRQSRQFASVCTGVPRTSLTALKEGKHPVLGYAFRQTTAAPAEVFALPAHSYSCRLRQYALQLCFGYDAASCSCMPEGVGARTDNPLSLP